MKKQEILARFDLIARRRIAFTTERSYRTWIVRYLDFLLSSQPYRKPKPPPVMTKPRFPRKLALGVVREILPLFQPSTEKLVIAGSLRRGKADVGDIEILYIPRRETRPVPGDMFQSRDYDLATEAIERMLADGRLALRPTSAGGTIFGDKNKLLLHVATGIPIDFFATSHDCWANYLVCRTGPAELNTRIASAALKCGLRWNPYGTGFSDSTTGRTVAALTEEDVFRFVGLPYLHPTER